MHCLVCSSALRAGDLFCSACGAVVPGHPPSPLAPEAPGRIAGERKYLTVLCVDLQRSTDLISELDPEEAISRLEPALIAMRTAVRRNRGIVSKEGGDGLIALFGAPHADDNHAVMACHAAVELVRRIKLLEDPDLHVRVGIHSGYVVTHVIEADFSSIYEAGGPAVHLVKRFESAAQAGQILVSESCQGLSAGLVTFKPLPPKQMMGFPAPVPCYELVQISGMTRWRARSTKGLSSFVGRGEQISQLQAAAQQVGASGQIAALVGTAGIGKSRLAHEFVASLRETNWQVLEADGNPLEQGVPYALLKKLLQSALQVGRIAPVDVSGQGDGDEDLWPAALASVLDQPVNDPRWANLEPLLRRRVIVDAIRATVEQVVATRPTVLLLEDLHWIDGQSEKVVEALMSLAATRPLLVLATWRTEHTPGWLAALEVRRIWLRSLDADAANTLLDDLLGSVAGLDALKAHILRHTGQIPLFIEEVARQLIGRGVGDAAKGNISWDALEVPPTVQGVIASRIDQLSKEDKTLLQLASVIGPQVSSHLLGTVTGMPAPQLQSRLWSLEILDFLTPARSLGSPDYAFAHDLIREVAYESILRSQREVLHRRILSAMEANFVGREHDVVEALCHHALEARDGIKADRYGQLAARKALTRSAFRDATNYFQSAIKAVDQLPYSIAREQRAIDLRIEARLAFAPLGSMEQWFELCAEAELRSKQIGDEERRLASIVAKSVALNFFGTPFEAVEAGEEAVGLAEQLQSAMWASYAEYGLGQAYFITGRYRDTRTYLDRASERLTAAPQNVPPGTTGEGVLVLCFMMKTIVCALTGEHDDALGFAEQATKLAETADRPYDLIAAGYGRGVMLMSRGDLEDAESVLSTAVSLAREKEVRLFLPLVLCALGNVLLQQGNAAQAKEVLLEAKGEAEALGYSSSVLLASTYLASARALLGDVSGGLESARTCQAIAKQKGYQSIEMLAIFGEGAILAMQGGAAALQAIARFERTIELSTKLETKPLLGLAKGMLARLLAATGRKEEAHEELLQAIAIFDRSRMTTHLDRAKQALSRFTNS